MNRSHVGKCLLWMLTGGAVFFVGWRIMPASQSAAAAPANTSEPKVEAPAGYKLVWSDEFTGDSIDPKKWGFDKGTFLKTGAESWQPGWGNGEMQYYTKRPENAFVKEGMLHLRVVRESYKGSQYTSARLNTKDLFSKAYGRFEFRAKLPTGKGVWPAIWMRPQDDKYGGWAASGEIDIMEARGQEPNKVLGTLHYGSGWPANAHSGKDFVFQDNGKIDEFHVYGLEWDPGEIRWLVDGKVYQTQNFWWSCSDRDGPNGVEAADDSEINPWPAPFDKPFYLILNVAVGGQFLGNPDGNTKFPVEMLVDYIRVYDRTGVPAPVKPRGAGRLPFVK